MKGKQSNHSLLKKRARIFLERMGFGYIKEEFRIKRNGSFYLVDVVGFRGQQKIAVECGAASYTKLRFLKGHFKEVWVYDGKEFMKFIGVNPQLTDYQELLKKYSELREEYEILKRKWEYISKPRSLRSAPKERTELLQIRCSKRVLMKFRKFMADKHFRTQEHALDYLIDLGQDERNLMERSLYKRSDASIEGPLVLKRGIDSK